MKPLRLMPSTLIFVSAAMLMGVITHLCIPFLSEVAGLESIIFWFICGGLGVFTPLIIADDASQRRGQIHKRDLCGATTIQTYDS